MQLPERWRARVGFLSLRYLLVSSLQSERAPWASATSRRLRVAREPGCRRRRCCRRFRTACPDVLNARRPAAWADAAAFAIIGENVEAVTLRTRDASRRGPV